MTLDPDTEWLVCVPDGARFVVDRSVLRACSRCTGAIWVAPSGVSILRTNPKARTVCTRCLPALQAEAQRSGAMQAVAPLTADQVAEVAQFEREHPL